MNDGVDKKEEIELPTANVLLVDDTPENLVALEVVLEDLDCNLIKAGSGQQALATLLKKDISLVLLDVQMPEMDGFEVAALMRENPKTRNIPIIFVTAISKEQKYVHQGYKAGAVDYLFKPIEPIILKGKVNFFLELDRQKRRLEAKLATARASEKAWLNTLNKGG
ncbi:MAG: response regulator [Pseudomonadota bacterium]